MIHVHSEGQNSPPSNSGDDTKLGFHLPPSPHQSSEPSAVAKSPNHSPWRDSSRHQSNAKATSSMFPVAVHSDSPGAASTSPPPIQSPSTLHPAQIDYQSLPSRPDIGYYSYNPSFGDQVCEAYNRNRMRHGWRVNKYGEELANAYKHGHTPSPVRQACLKWQKEYERYMALGSPSSEESSEDENERQRATSSSATSPHSVSDKRTEGREQVDVMRSELRKVRTKRLKDYVDITQFLDQDGNTAQERPSKRGRHN